ncbi:MAG: histidine--tRNA ligase [Candidatus Cloacimonetes bacterium]|nr:histidine--tRNA ligase [Candidatus Cloacimonadota bacterium]
MAGKYKIPRGTYDILPSESYKRQYLEQTFRAVAENFGYREIVTPIFEQSALFERSVGDSSDIVQKEMYKFTDRKGREFALRPEGTAAVVRSFVENNLANQENGNRLYYLGPMFRYDRPQKGRHRQFYQYGIENFDSDHPYIDAEVIALGYTFLQKLGLQNFILEINSIGSRNCAADFDQALIDFFDPHKDLLCSDCQHRLEKNPKRVLDCKVPSCQEIAADAPSMLNYLDKECSDHFQAVQEYLNLMDIPFTVNPRIVRGLDYYSKTAFEFLNNNLGAQNALCGGGRYDYLVEEIGGKPTTGIGFAGGFERLQLSLEAENACTGTKSAPAIFFVTMGDRAEKTVISILQKLRLAGISAGFDIDKKSLKAQMKAADKSNAQYSVVLGDDEMATGTATLRNMKSGEQQQTTLAELVTLCKNLL